MSNEELEFLVFSLSAEDFDFLKEQIAKRENIERYGASNFEELAEKCGRKPICPKCHSENVRKDGYTPQGKQRYVCCEPKCGTRFNLLTDSIFNSTKKSFDTWTKYLTLMSFNVPLVMTEEMCGISHRTAMLWRKKVHHTVNGYQNRIKLRDKVWIDETYVFDSETLRDGLIIKKRGISDQQICIVVAIDSYMNVYAKICGHGKPTKNDIYDALKEHIEPGATIIHDGEKAHMKLIEKLNCDHELFKCNTKSKYYLKNMALINNLCSWIKRYIYRFVGMKPKHLQSYLNWFVYMFRVNKGVTKWPKMQRILRHLVLDQGRLKQKSA